jgi:hypothetical protein
MIRTIKKSHTTNTHKKQNTTGVGGMTKIIVLLDFSNNKIMFSGKLG